MSQWRKWKFKKIEEFNSLTWTLTSTSLFPALPHWVSTEVPLQGAGHSWTWLRHFTIAGWLCAASENAGWRRTEPGLLRVSSVRQTLQIKVSSVVRDRQRDRFSDTNLKPKIRWPSLGTGHICKVIIIHLPWQICLADASCHPTRWISIDLLHVTRHTFHCPDWLLGYPIAYEEGILVCACW